MAITDATNYSNGTASRLVKTGSGAIAGIYVNSHTSGTLEIFDGISDQLSYEGAVATGTLVIESLPTDGMLVVVGSQYRFKDVLTDPNDVKIGADEAECALNLSRAVRGGPGAGTSFHVGTIANPDVLTSITTPGTLDISARVAGTAGNSLTAYGIDDESHVYFTPDGGDVFSPGVTLSGGEDPVHQICTTITLASGPQAVSFPEPIAFHNGLYVKKGGTINFTVLYY